MAQVIKIKRSSSTAEPSSLNQGELAYSSNSKKLFIGNPGDAAVTEIGGLHFVEMLKGTRVLPNNLIIGDGADGGAYIELREDTDNGSNYVRLKSPDSLGANLTFTLPTADGSDGQFIKTDGNGNLSFVSQVSANDATITISGGTGLKTGGNFTTNQSSAETITLNLDVNGLTSLSGAVEQTDAFIIADASSSNAERKLTFSTLEDAIFGNISGDATVAAGGALTIANDAVENAMIAAGAVDTTELAAAAVETAKIANDAVTNAKLANMTQGTIKVGGTSNAPTDLDAKTDGYILIGDGTDVNSVAVSGDVTIDNTGAVTIGAGVVENSMLAGSIANGKLANSAVTVTAGDGLGGGGSVSLGSSVSLNVNVDDSSIETNGDSLRVKAGGITNAMLAGSIANGKLVNDSVTIGSTEIDLGASSATLAGLTKVTSTDLVGNLSKTDASGTNTAGSNLTIQGGAGTGSGAGGSVIIQVADGGASGSSVNSHATALTIADDKTMTAAGNVVISGNLTVSGTTTTVNSETVTFDDNILVLNNNYSGSSPTENGGLEVERGTVDNAKFLFNETTDKWQVGIGSTMSNLLTGSNFETEITSIDGGSF
jgi:hypothetical protein